MRTGIIILGLSLALLAGCDRHDRGREKADRTHRSGWQIIQQPDAAAVWRLDTATGTLSYCHADFTNRLVLCMQQAVVPTEATAAPAAAGTQPVTAPPVYTTQPRSPAP